MTDEEVKIVVEEMERMFGKLPDPLHEPIQFAHYVKLYRYYVERNSQWVVLNVKMIVGKVVTAHTGKILI